MDTISTEGLMSVLPVLCSACSDCGASLSMSARGQGLQCIRYTKGQCKTSHYISVKKLNEMVIGTLEACFRTGLFKVVVKNIQPTAEITEIDVAALIEKEVQKYARIKEAFEAGVYTIDELRESRDLIDQRINALRAQVKPQHSEIALREKIIEENKDAIQTLRDPSVSEEEKNALLHSFIDRIVFDRKDSTIDVIFYV